MRGAAPGASVEARTSLRMPTGRAEDWVTWARAGDDGVARFRLPYATGLNGAVRADGRSGAKCTSDPGQAHDFRQCSRGTHLAPPMLEPHGAVDRKEVDMRVRTFIAIAAGLLLAGPAFAGDMDMTQDRLQDGTGDGTPDLVKAQDRLRLHTDSEEAVLAVEEAEGTGTLAHERVRTQTRERAGEATPAESGALVRERARFGACEVAGEAACEAHHAVRNALAEGAGMPAEPPAVPGKAVRAAERHTEAVGAALRHAERHAVREQAGEAARVSHGAGPAAGGASAAPE